MLEPSLRVLLMAVVLPLVLAGSDVTDSRSGETDSVDAHSERAEMHVVPAIDMPSRPSRTGLGAAIWNSMWDPQSAHALTSDQWVVIKVCSVAALISIIMTFMMHRDIQQLRLQVVLIQLLAGFEGHQAGHVLERVPAGA